MCGIAGFMSVAGEEVSENFLKKFSHFLKHRGPDGEGFFQTENVALIHRRLSIIDIEGGGQPFLSPQGYALIANGEIYNYKALKERLLQEDPSISFQSHSDCEPLLYLYQQRGEDFLKELRGMYGLALYDPFRKQLLLARDPFGIKPLYYAETAEGLYFASEAGALYKILKEFSTSSLSLNEESRDIFLELQFQMGAPTLFSSIKRVLPGEALQIEKGRIVKRSRLPALPLPIFKSPLSNLEDALLLLDDFFKESVALHLQSDVPVGLFLSGGIDSSSILEMAGRVYEKPLYTYTLGFPKTSVHDERKIASLLLKNKNVIHQEVEFAEKDFWYYLPQVAAALDDPVADYATLPTFKLAAIAKEDVKVVLSGEGGDELFAGYGRYRKALRPWWLGGGTSLRRKGILTHLDLLRKPTLKWKEEIKAVEKQVTLPGRTPLQILQAIDCEDWLPNDLLTKLDRCLMYHGIEGRTPFVDLLMAQFAYVLPDSFKIQGRLGKWILRKWLERQNPQSNPFGAKKGFTVPIGEWISNQGEALAPLVATQPGILEIANPSDVRALFTHLKSKHQIQAAWILLFYALWHHIHILNYPPQSTVLETLSQAY